MLLLLILFAGCLATSAAQTATAFQAVVNVTTPGVLQTTADPQEYVAILQAAGTSTVGLNNTLALIQDQLYSLIVQKLQADPGITLIRDKEKSKLEDLKPEIM